MRPRRGVVLIIALLVLLAIEAVAIAVIYMALHESLIAGTHDRILRARLAAEAAAVTALRDSTTETPPPPARTADGFLAAGAVEQLAGGLALAHGRARDERGIRFRTGLLFTSADPLTLLPLFDVESANSGSGATDGRTLIDALAAAADRVEDGLLALRPATAGGTCSAAAHANWGAPLEPAHPCADYFPLVLIDGDARVIDGAGQGVLVVRGRLVLEPGSHFFGAILVTGELVIAPGAALVGAVHAPGGAESIVAGAIEYSDSAVRRALLGSAALRRALPSRPIRWLPLY
jgi:hypothetical protein